LSKLRETLKVRKERAVLVGAVAGTGGEAANLAELTALSQSAGAVVIDNFRQKINTVNPATYIGRGKAEQLRKRVRQFDADVVIFDNDLSPGQIRELEEIVNVKVLDRSELILDIFATRAKTKQARLQVELAQLEYTYPRLTRMWSHLDTVVGAGGATTAGAVGGIGTRGPGEQQLEIDRRLVNKRITELKRQLRSIDRRKIREIDGRRDMFKICLVGYTNAGKSTLLNAVTGAGALVEDRLFATLDTRTRKWRLEGAAEVLLSDTIGFIKNLPHQLVASFKATLEEAVGADLLVHIIDVSSAEAMDQIEAVNTVLGEIGCGEKSILKVFNKIDAVRKISDLETLQTVFPEAICISAKTSLGLEQMRRAVLERYRGGEVAIRVRAGQSNGRVAGFLRAYGQILKEQYLNGQVVIEARLGQNQLAPLKKLGAESVEHISA